MSTLRPSASSSRARGGSPPQGGEREAVRAILDAALALIRERRALDLSMREIAAKAGVAPSLVSYHFTSKSQLVADACSLAGEAWREHLAELSRLLSLALTVEQRADCGAAWIGGLASARPDLARLWGDVLLAAAHDPALARVAGEWVGAWREAWRGCGANAWMIAEFAAFEMLFAAPMSGAADRDLIMREALRRVMRRAEGAALRAEDSHWHTLLCLDRMDPLSAGQTREASVRNRIIEATADIISEQGAPAASHRAVAARAGASLSSMTYHFENRAMLVREGLLRVFQRAMTARPLEGAPPKGRVAVGEAQMAKVRRDASGAPGERLVMVRAIAEVAQGAASDGEFRAVATELRRIRGLVTRQSIAHALGLDNVAGADAADYAVWESGAALLYDAEQAAGGGALNTQAAIDAFFLAR